MMNLMITENGVTFKDLEKNIYAWSLSSNRWHFFRFVFSCNPGRIFIFIPDLISCQMQQPFPVSLDFSFQSHDVAYCRIFIPSPFFSRRFRRSKDFFTN